MGLNDWGKKDAGRLAFEDIEQLLEHHYYIVPSLLDRRRQPGAAEGDGRAWRTASKRCRMRSSTRDALGIRQREGYLNQKICDPRSYDYNRIRAWDDRSRMPQFRFARPRRKAKESDEDFEARTNKEEAEAREAVATFILGLVAEPVPAESINQPRGDRLAEVKGRQVLDKFNCSGCHLIRPGAFDIKLTEESLKKRWSKRTRCHEETRQAGGDHYLPATTPTGSARRPPCQIDLRPRSARAAHSRSMRMIRPSNRRRFG